MRPIPDRPFAKDVRKVMSMNALRVGGRHRVSTVVVCRLGTGAPAGGTCRSAELALSVFVHDPVILLGCGFIISEEIKHTSDKPT